MLNHYRKNLRAAVGSSAGPYGYTLATWTTGAVLMNAHGVPDTLAALAFMAGAVHGFVFVGVLAFGGLTKRFDRERGQALLWGSFHFFSVGLAIGAAALVTYYVQSFIACPRRPSCRQPSTFSSWEPSPPPRTNGTTGRKTEQINRSAQTPLHQKAPLLGIDDDRGGIQLQHLLRRE
jgi:hypothetical protein